MNDKIHQWVLRFSSQCFWRQKSYGIQHNVVRKVVPDVSWDCGTFFTSSNLGNYLPDNQTSYSTRLECKKYINLHCT